MNNHSGENQLSLIVDKLFNKAGIDKQISLITPLKGDASSRQYARVYADDSTFIVMKLSGTSGPLMTNNRFLSQDDSFVAVFDELEASDIPLAEILADGREFGYLLIEDVGDSSLASVLEAGSTDVLHIMKKVIKVIKNFQSLSPVNNSQIFERYKSEENLKEEALRFVTLYLEPQNKVDKQVYRDVGLVIGELCADLEELPKSLMHHDLMAWNIHVLLDRENEVKIIDYQDSCQAHYVYDLISLLHDRDIDRVIGSSGVSELYCFAASLLSKEGRDFSRDCYLGLLQRSLRLTGQFTYLSKVKGTSKYADWIPGLLSRICLCSNRLGGSYSLLSDIILSQGHVSDDRVDWRIPT